MAEKPERKVYLNGEFVSERDAKISIFDSALMFGDMVFEMTRSFNQKQHLLRRHLERMYRGIKMLRIPMKIRIEEMEDLVSKTMEANAPAFDPDDEHRIMINVSRGPLGMYKMVFDGKLESTVAIADFPVKWTVAGFADAYETGVQMATPSQRAIPSPLLEAKIKHRSRMHYMFANIQVSMLKDPHALALLLDPDGFIAEGTGANFFIVRDGKLYTPEPRNILLGIKRGYVMELAASMGIETVEKNLELYDAYHADEAFLTSTGFSMLPVTRINTIPIADAKPGPVFNRLLSAWCCDVGVDIVAQTKDFAARIGDALKGTNMYRFAGEDEAI